MLETVPGFAKEDTGAPGSHAAGAHVIEARAETVIPSARHCDRKLCGWGGSGVGGVSVGVENLMQTTKERRSLCLSIDFRSGLKTK